MDFSFLMDTMNIFIGICKTICGKEKKEKKMPLGQNAVVAVTFLDFQANILPLLLKSKNSKFPI
jgi:hypothetical protein